MTVLHNRILKIIVISLENILDTVASYVAAAATTTAAAAAAADDAAAAAAAAAPPPGCTMD